MALNEQNLMLLPHTCRLNMQAIYRSLKSAERHAADFLLSQPRQVCKMGIVAFASLAGCSEATVVRLSKKLGYAGYPMLKRDFERFHAHTPVDSEYEHLQGRDTPRDILPKVFEASLQGLRDTLAIIDPKKFTDVVTALGKAATIMFCGVGDAGVVAMEASHRFLRAGFHSLFAADSDIQLIQASQLRTHDVMIAISHTGRTTQVIETANIASENGATIVGLTNFPLSPLGKQADILLQTAVFSKSFTGEVMAKRISALCIIEGLYIAALAHAGVHKKEFLTRSDRVVAMRKS